MNELTKQYYWIAFPTQLSLDEGIKQSGAFFSESTKAKSICSQFARSKIAHRGPKMKNLMFNHSVYKSFLGLKTTP